MSVTTVTIKSEGAAMDETYSVVSVTITKEVNRIPTAEIKLVDGDSATQTFPVCDSSFFEPGSSVEILARYEGETDHSLFTGLVVRQFVAAGRSGSTLTVQLKDASVLMTRARDSAVYTEQSDTDIIKSLISDAGLSAGTVPATKPAHPEIVRYRSTAWDFLVLRADAQGLLVVADAGEITLAPMEVTGSAAHSFEFGLDPLHSIQLELDGESQFKGVKSTAWDPAAQAMTGATSAAEPQTGAWDGAKVAGSIGTAECALMSGVPLDPDELKAWADGHLARNRLALERGSLTIPGKGDIALLDEMEIAGVGSRLSGTTMVTGLGHHVSDGGWVTDVHFGLRPDYFNSEPEIAEPAAAGLLAPVGGLQIGVVADFEEDPSEEFRLRVVVPGVSSDAQVWARLSAPDAGTDRGWFFRPEVGDEVVLGFLNDDPRQAIILGSLHSSAIPPHPDLPIDADNVVKGIVTRAGTVLEFSDAEKPAVRIETPNANQILLDDDAEEITITDQHGNSATLSADGVTVKSAKDLIFEADGDIKVEAGGNVEIKGSKVDVK